MPTTANKGYSTPTFNSSVGTWGVTDLNGNSAILDSNLGGSTSVALTNSNVTLSSSQAQNLTIVLTGTLTANVTVSSPCIGFFFIVNNTTGNFAVTIQANFGSGAVGSGWVAPQGIRQLIVSDTTNGIQLAAMSASSTPVGALQAYAGSSAPTGWLLCYGQAISRTIYAALFAAISTTYGSGDGSTTFNVPDLRGRALFGLDNMGGSAAGRLTGSATGNITSPTTLGSTGGQENHTLLTAEIPSHGHGVNDPGHTHPSSTPNQAAAVAGGATWSVWYSTLPNSTGAATTGISIQNTGGGGTHNTTPPAMTVNVLIKAF